MTEDTLKQDIVRRLDRLSPEALREVRDFTAFLQQKSSSASVFDQIDASIQAIADEDWDQVPDDASEHLDAHLYESEEP